ncbi:hypothetical protein CB343_002294 [Salmonella enterica subsp. diarizonae]|nr:hypothetical protein [Salmonella enterica subsp. diarizonae]
MSNCDYLLPDDELMKIYEKITNEIDSIYEITNIIRIGCEIEGVFKDKSILFFDFLEEFINERLKPELKTKDKNYVSCVFVYLMLSSHGYSEHASEVLVALTSSLCIEGLMEKHTENYIKNEKSKAKKGKTNRHHDSALKIAMCTWYKYPNASLAGMTEEIHAHLRSKWNDTPAAETIKSWLKKSNLYPDAKPKNRDFKLVINEEG